MGKVQTIVKFRNNRSEQWFNCVGGHDLRVSEVSKVGANGWAVCFGDTCGSFWVPNDLCKEPPKIGEEIWVLPYRSLEFERTSLWGVAVIGLEIGGRRYIYQTDEEYAAERARHAQEAEDSLNKMKEEFIASGAASRPLPEFAISDPTQWKRFLEDESQNPYGFACLRYAARWANLMEARLAAGATDVASIAKEMSHEADDDGITGFMYGVSVFMLSKCWARGEELRRWHNLDTQIGDEGEKANASGGVLNPALLTTG